MNVEDVEDVVNWKEVSMTSSAHKSVEAAVLMDKFDLKVHSLKAVVDKRLSTEGGTLTESPKITNIHELVSDESSSPAAKEVAVKILAGSFKEVAFTEYANYLGAPGNRQVLREFIGLLKPLPQSLVLTLRKLSSSVYFIAEAANIDSILEALAKQWLQAHDVAHYCGDYRLCHIVLFSLLILNSDLHNSMAAETRFKKEEFVNNTIYALQKERSDLDVAAFSDELSMFYDCLEKEQLALLKPTTNTNMSRLTKRTSTSSSYSGMRKPSILSMRGSAGLERSSSRQSLASNMSTVTTRETHASVNSKYHQGKPLEKLYLEEPIDSQMQEINRSPWLMDSFVLVQEASKVVNSTPQLLSNPQSRKKKLFSWFKKHSRESIFDEHSHLSTKEHWTRARMRVAEGRLLLFYFKNSATTTIHQDEMMKWDLDTCKKKCSQYRVYNLHGTLATLVQDNIVASNESRSSPANFTLVFPRLIDSTGGLSFHFKTDNIEVARSFTESCNFWSGRITPIPSAQIEMVSNAEYGWSTQVLERKANPLAVRLTHWEPLMGLDAVFEDTYEGIALWDFDSQLYGLRIFTETLSELIDKHNALKPLMVVVWSEDAHVPESLFERAMDNWNNKYLYLNKQYERHIVYLKALQGAKDFQSKLTSNETRV